VSAVAQGEDAPAQEPMQLRALKHGDSFLVADPSGDLLAADHGLFDNDTRILSHLRLRLGGRAPSLLSDAISEDNVFFTANMTNRPLPPLGGEATPEGVIHLERKRFLWEHRLYERLSLVNYGQIEATVPLSLRFDADFRDMFEVRGAIRPAHGTRAAPEVTPARVVLRYAGLDGVARACVIGFSPAPVRLTAEQADFVFTLGEGGQARLFIEIGPEAAAADAVDPVGRTRYRRAAARARWAMRAKRQSGARIDTPMRLFHHWVGKSAADLALLVTELPTGPFPYAGIPWFSTTFGRDAIITALQTLWLDPTLARGVLLFLAQNQAHRRSRFRDAAPGKIMHEARKGEMTALRELPFGRYYGGVDTTPLFVMLAGAYAERTGDLAFIETLWPSLLAAMGWIERQSAGNRDGFLDYARGERGGLANQGWKDSVDSVFHADGRFPDGPIALVEVQGYAYAAARAMGRLAARRGDAEAMARWATQAETLRVAVEEKFWMEEAGFYGLAIDGHGALCRVRASNAGHLLFTGLASPERAAQVMAQFAAPEFASGWGIRTLAQGAPHFNPMSYHNGSVWPHDTALCVAGFARYGERTQAVQVLNDVFEAALHFGLQLPELFCGFPRTAGEPPVAYPVACLPQAWAAGSVFMMLQACLGLSIDGWQNEVHIEHPSLPLGVDRLRLRGLRVGRERIDLTFQRFGERVVCLPEGHRHSAIRVLARD
jgi:glycogen debranching enzyme